MLKKIFIVISSLTIVFDLIIATSTHQEILYHPGNVKSECSKGYWQCNNKWCVQNGYVCDGDDNCADGSDEESEICQRCKESNEWSCLNGRLCIPTSLLCNGVDDCGDNSDEDSTRCYRSTTVRLINGESSSLGSLQIRKYGTWGSVCDKNWDYKDATVICNMLGFKGPAAPYTRSYFGVIEGLIWINNVNCSGKEKNIDKCSMDLALDTNSCDPTNIAGVMCLEETDLKEKCGQRFINRNSDAKIVGGYPALYGEFPWQVEVVNKTDSDHWCGGTIIDEFHVVSAAHCYGFEEFQDPSIWLLKIGNLWNDEDDLEEQNFEVEQIFIHEDFKWPTEMNDTYNHDIALFKIKSNNGHGIQYGKYVQPACLIDKETEVPVGIECFTSGWGDIFFGARNGSNVLKGTPVEIISNSYCQSPEIYDFKVSEYMICAGYKEGLNGNCQGDSGGPLVCPLNGTFTLTGIVSFGEGCAWPHYPVVYAKVSPYLDWIEAKRRL